MNTNTSGKARALLRTSAPKSDESFPGYLLRLTELNKYDTPSWILKLIGIKNRLHNNFSFIFDSSLDLAQMSLVSGIDADELSTLQYAPEGVSRYAGNYFLHNCPVPQFMIRVRRPKVCFECLLEESYCRKIWEFSLVTTCPKHRCLLRDSCPNCEKPISWIRKKISVCPCKSDWRDIREIQVVDKELLISAHIHRLCNIPIRDTPKLTIAPPNPLLTLQLGSFSSALLFVAAQFEGIVDTKGKHLAPSRSNAELHALLSRALPVFDNWPQNYYLFLDWRRKQYEDSRYVSGQHRDFTQYKNALYQQLSARDFDFLRGAYEEYLSTRWDGGHINRSNRRLSLSALDKKKYASRNEAMRTLRVDLTSIGKLLNKGILRAVIRRAGNSSLILIERSSIEEFNREFSQAIYLDDVARLLHITVKRTMELVKAGLLNPLRGPIVDGCGDWKFSRREVEGLLGCVDITT